MIRIRFRSEAEADLRGIIEWYETVAPDSLSNILADLNRSIDLLARYPKAGMAVPARAIRRIATRRYRFKIAYRVEADWVTIIGIFRYQDRES